jgi:hypothetical protein
LEEILTIVRLGRELLAGNELARHFCEIPKILLVCKRFRIGGEGFEVAKVCELYVFKLLRMEGHEATPHPSVT